jgi:hypothetical protein
MGFAIETIIYLLITTLMSVSITLGYADGKNATYVEVAATEAMLKAPPYGYITPQIQADIKNFLRDTRGMDPALISITGTIDTGSRKMKGSSDDIISLQISYPRKVLIFMGGVQTSTYRSKRSILTEFTGS